MWGVCGIIYLLVNHSNVTNLPKLSFWNQLTLSCWAIADLRRHEEEQKRPLRLDWLIPICAPAPSPLLSHIFTASSASLFCTKCTATIVAKTKAHRFVTLWCDRAHLWGCRDRFEKLWSPSCGCTGKMTQVENKEIRVNLQYRFFSTSSHIIFCKCSHLIYKFNFSCTSSHIIFYKCSHPIYKFNFSCTSAHITFTSSHVLHHIYLHKTTALSVTGTQAIKYNNVFL